MSKLKISSHYNFFQELSRFLAKMVKKLHSPEFELTQNILFQKVFLVGINSERLKKYFETKISKSISLHSNIFWDYVIFGQNSE